MLENRKRPERKCGRRKPRCKRIKPRNRLRQYAILCMPVKILGGCYPLPIPMNSLPFMGRGTAARCVFDVAQDMHRFIQHVEENKQFSNSSYLEYCVAKYHKFVSLQKAHRDVALVPTPAIDIAWQAHMIRSRPFRDCCFDLPDRVDSGVSFRPHTIVNKSEFETTAKLWKSTFGEEYIDLPANASEEALAAASVIGPHTDLNMNFLSPALLRDDQVMYADFKLKSTDLFLVSDQQYQQALATVMPGAGDEVFRIITAYSQGDPSFRLAAAHLRFLKWVYAMNTADRKTAGKSGSFVPEGLTDFVWHAHQVQPKKLAALSQALFGKVECLDHDPLPIKQVCMCA
jgi:hypothetical protein